MTIRGRVGAGRGGRGLNRLRMMMILRKLIRGVLNVNNILRDVAGGSFQRINVIVNDYI